jgi:hypothetical protein
MEEFKIIKNPIENETDVSTQKIIKDEIGENLNNEELNKEKDTENGQKIESVKEEILKHFEKKEEYPEGHIFNSQMLDKIAQLSAISTNDDHEFMQSVYDQYIKEEKEGKNGKNSVSYNQENLKKLIEDGYDSKEDIYQFDSEIIYGFGGWLRFKIDKSGSVRLESGQSATNTTGDKKYFQFLINKGKELGMDLIDPDGNYFFK